MDVHLYQQITPVIDQRFLNILDVINVPLSQVNVYNTYQTLTVENSYFKLFIVCINRNCA